MSYKCVCLFYLHLCCACKSYHNNKIINKKHTEAPQCNEKRWRDEQQIAKEREKKSGMCAIKRNNLTCAP